MTRISIPLTVEERESLRLSAQKAMRDPRDHARFILRSALLGEKSQESKKPSTVSDLTEQAVGRMEIKKVFREGIAVRFYNFYVDDKFIGCVGQSITNGVYGAPEKTIVGMAIYSREAALAFVDALDQMDAIFAEWSAEKGAQSDEKQRDDTSGLD